MEIENFGIDDRIYPRGRMKVHYYAETDSLYINLSERVSVDSQEIAPGVIIDFDDGGNLVGIDIDRASKIVNLKRLEAESLPVALIKVTNDKRNNDKSAN